MRRHWHVGPAYEARRRGWWWDSSWGSRGRGGGRGRRGWELVEGGGEGWSGAEDGRLVIENREYEVFVTADNEVQPVKSSREAFYQLDIPICLRVAFRRYGWHEGVAGKGEGSRMGCWGAEAVPSIAGIGVECRGRPGSLSAQAASVPAAPAAPSPSPAFPRSLPSTGASPACACLPQAQRL